MKLRTIALAGLLGAGLLMTAGCNETDVVKAAGDAAKFNVVNVVNGYNDTIIAHADDDKETLKVGKQHAFALKGKSENAVYYEVGNNQSKETKFKYGSSYLYVASDKCNLDDGFGSIKDETTGKGEVRVINATNDQYTVNATNSVIVIVDGKEHKLSIPVGTSINGCDMEASATKIAELGIKKGSMVSVKIGDANATAPYKVKNDIPTTVDVDVVYLGGTMAVAVPLPGFDDLAK